jgi:hypothetical protein
MFIIILHKLRALKVISQSLIDIIATPQELNPTFKHAII